MHLPDDRAISRAELAAALPPPWTADPRPQIRQQIQAGGRKVVVLDDDPTGTQTVHDLWVLTQWTPDTLRPALTGTNPVFYILTNSRSLAEPAAVALNRELATNLASVAREVGCELDVVSRSDSTLRGHFPAEIEALQETLESRLAVRYDGIIVCPFFLEGGRLTAGDIHWVAEGDELTPAALTEFARDATFGYSHSNLRRWVEEKTRGRVAAGQVVSVSLEVIRTQGPEGVQRILQEVTGGRVVVVNAVTYQDMAVFVAGLLAAEASGRHYLFRTAASFVKVRGAVPDQELLGGDKLAAPGPSGGLVVVGSYVQKSTRQLRQALALPDVVPVELSVAQVLDPGRRQGAIERAIRAADQALANGRDAVVYTSRELVTERGRAGDLDVGEQVSGALVAVLRGITATPRFIVAKGGITSSDLATQGLEVQRAWVLGQILPGVPVWRLEAESRFPGLSYVVFPGNVGNDNSLAEVIQILRG